MLEKRAVADHPRTNLEPKKQRVKICLSIYIYFFYYIYKIFLCTHTIHISKIDTMKLFLAWHGFTTNRMPFNDTDSGLK